MIAVLDVSGAAQILLQTPKKEKFKTVLQNAKLVISLDLYVSELSNTLWKFCTKKIYSEEECLQFIEDGLKYIDTFTDSKELWKEAFGEAVKNKHPVYDMFYAVLARRNEGILITNDGDLAKICERLNIKYCF
jgi:predicted nucleic acid-binding protein